MVDVDGADLLLVCCWVWIWVVREVRCEYFDGITDYRVIPEADAKAEGARLEAFGDFLNTEHNPNKI